MRVGLRLSVVCLAADAVGVRRPGAVVYRGNDTGGIIPWSCENEAAAQEFAGAFCARYGKFHRITSVTPGVRQLHRLQLPVAAGHRALSSSRRCAREHWLRASRTRPRPGPAVRVRY